MIRVKFELGMSVPDAIFIAVIVGGVVSVGIDFANVIYCISAILREKSQFDPLSVPVYTVDSVVNSPSESVRSKSVPVKPEGTEATG